MHSLGRGSQAAQRGKQGMDPKTSSSLWGCIQPATAPWEGQRPAVPALPSPPAPTHDPSSSSKDEGLRGGSGASHGGTFPSRGQSQHGEALPEESRLMGCCRHPGARLRRRKAICPLLGTSSSSPACFQPCPGECGHIQDRARSDAHLHQARGGHGKVLEGCPPGHSPIPAPSPPRKPDLKYLPPLSILQTGNAAPPRLRRLGVPFDGVSTPQHSRCSKREGRREGCLAAGEGLKRNYSLHKNIHSSQGP